ncbi:selenocysteine-specific translation elongation factor [Brevibacterium album]|uniref:selenocysteine-specific translation elongation factor n=1 Tax=Brevibacterium album TaxID=417948 RepID=UPI0004054E00|nr:SelB C-terminal domain-containing protein [Brevibacterium album]
MTPGTAAGRTAPRTPASHVIATAGHVDHGKSTLVRALTGIEPDRWDEEKRRGLTIDLGFAWTTLPSGREISFVDVPGHERFLGNMLAGLGPAPVVLFVIAADEGWMPQSSDHRDAVAALGIQHGLIVVTRTDAAPEAVPAVVERARAEFAGTGLAHAPAVAVSALANEAQQDPAQRDTAAQDTAQPEAGRISFGLAALREQLDAVLADMPVPDPGARVRLWADRAFSVAGSGTVVTGTLDQGSLRVGGELELASAAQARTGGAGTGSSGRTGGAASGGAGGRDGAGAGPRVGIRGLQTHNDGVEALRPVTRAAVNLRGVAAEDVHRGDALVTPGAWVLAETVDVRRRTGEALDAAPLHLTVHLGTAAVQARLRPFDAEHGRLVLDRPLPLAVGDRMLLRSTGERSVLGGVDVLDVDPPELHRRGAARRRAAQLARLDPAGDVAVEVRRRGAVDEPVLLAMGIEVPEELPAGIVRLGEALLADEARIRTWAQMLIEVVEREHAKDALSRGVTGKAAADALDLPDLGAARSLLLGAVVRAADLAVTEGRIRARGAAAGLGAAEGAMQKLEAGWRQRPFHAPEAHELRALGLGTRELAAAEQRGRLLRLGGPAGRGGAGTSGGTAKEGEGIVLGPTAPAQAMRLLAGLEQPFTTSQARQALDTTRRTVIPLLEHLDARGWTRRLDAGHREVVR